jgi:transaldolase
MAQPNYLQMLAAQTPTQFWHDSGEPAEIQTALNNGAVGVTTNPILIPRVVLAHPDEWRVIVRHMARFMPVQDIPHAITAQVVAAAADMVLPIYAKTQGGAGYVCAQGNPNNHGNVQAMVNEAVAFHAVRPNIANKIPCSAAGLDAVEELTARGITTTCTTSFTVPQVLAIAEAFGRGRKKLKADAGQVRCFAVIMAGRLDDHLRDEVKAGRGQASEAAITIAGLAVCKRAVQLYRERGYGAILLVGGMRGLYHVTELVGAPMVLTIAPAMQPAIIEKGFTLRTSIGEPVDADLLREMANVPDFQRAYEPDGMEPAEFSGYGAFVKTQGQFIENYGKLQEFIAQSLA